MADTPNVATTPLRWPTCAHPDCGLPNWHPHHDAHGPSYQHAFAAAPLPVAGEATTEPESLARAINDLRWYAGRLCKDKPERYGVTQTFNGTETKLSDSCTIVLAALTRAEAARDQSEANEAQLWEQLQHARAQLATAEEARERAEKAPDEEGCGIHRHPCPQCLGGLLAALAAAQRETAELRKVIAEYVAAEDAWRPPSPAQGSAARYARAKDAIRRAALRGTA